jgi:S1-C subfamily serine protease
VAAATGAGAVLTLHHDPVASQSSGPTHRDTGTAGNGVSSTTEQAVVNAVQPGLVDISSNLGYQGGAAAATGMVISSNGLVLTNNHVITDTTGLVATLVSSGRQFQAKWLGYDSAADVAVIQLVGAHGLKTVPIGDSAQVKLGDSVIALGNAQGAGGAPAVVGSITGLNRTITASDNGAGTSETLHGMLQTDAGIVPGDSGGPLASTAGKVIGMNTAAASGSFGDGSQNVGFAIPINNALAIANRIIHGQSSPTIQIGSTGFMGVLVPAGRASQSNKPRVQRQLQAQQNGSAFAGGTACLRNDLGAGVPAHVAPASSGALIIGDICGTPAAKAGITAGDVITSVGGHRVTSPKQLTSIMLGFKPGLAVPVIWVDVSGHTHSSSLLLAQAPPR